MVLGPAGGRSMTWLPVGRFALSAVFLAGSVTAGVTVEGPGGALLLPAFFLATAAAGLWTLRWTRREADLLVVRSLRDRRQVRLGAGSAVTLRRSGSLSFPVVEIVAGSRRGTAVVASLSGASAGATARQARRAAAALDLPFDEPRWRRWLETGRDP